MNRIASPKSLQAELLSLVDSLNKSNHSRVEVSAKLAALATGTAPIAREKIGASPIDLSEVDPELLGFIEKLEHRFGKVTYVWDGIHGTIVDFEIHGSQNHRLNEQDLRFLMSDPRFRWVEAERDGVSVGM